MDKYLELLIKNFENVGYDFKLVPDNVNKTKM